MLVASVLIASILGCASAQGPQGDRGPQGPSPSDEALKSLINQVVTDRLEDLRGPQGLTGASGPQGLQGPQGDRGPQGAEGAPLMVVSRPDVVPASTILVGTWRVGVDIQPGLYWTEGPEPGRSSCYWARLSGFGGSGEIIANDNAPGPGYVSLAPSDVGFETQCVWVRIEE